MNLQLNIFSCKLEGKEGVDRVEDENLGRSVKKDAHGSIEAALRFEQHLAAGATRSNGRSEKFAGRVGRRNGEGEHGTLGEAAFSWLLPQMISPLSNHAAAPTLNLE